jgi:hypothetical protein
MTSPSSFSSSSILFCLLALAACASAPGDDAAAQSGEQALAGGGAPAATLPVQLNDVSVLLPLPATQKEFASLLAADAKGAAGILLDRPLYENATGFTPPTMPIPPGGSPGLLYTDLRMTAFRLDPCFAHLGPITDPSKCENQLRIVLQPVFFGTQVSVADGGIHVFYSLTRAELLAAVEEVAALRVAQGGTADLGPLAVHPIVKAQGLTGAMARGLQAIVLKYAGMSRLERFTVLQATNLDADWNFSGFDVTHAGGVAKTTPMIVPTLPANTTSVIFFGGFSQSDLFGSFTPATKSADDMHLLANQTDATAATPAARQAAYDAALRIENPNLHSPNTIDCASCHMAGPARVRVGEQIFKLSATGDANAFVPDAKYVSAADAKTTTPFDPKDNGVELHAFSYKNVAPMINQRVMNETAAVIAYLNGTVLGRAR